MNQENLVSAMRLASSARIEGDRSYDCIPLEVVRELAGEFSVSTREISIAALEEGIVPLKYLKNIGTVGLDGQARLLGSKVAVVGAGGIGGRACELLARNGVGHILMVDPDIFDQTNLNRQDFANEDLLGSVKVAVIGEHLRKINGDIEVDARRLAVDRDNLPDIIAGADVVIDALDNLSDRLILQEACRSQNVIMVHGAIAGTYIQAMTVFPGDPGLEVLIPKNEGDKKTRGIEVETGNPATTPTLVAAIEVHEAVKVILNSGTTLRGKMLYLDLDDWTFELVDL